MNGQVLRPTFYEGQILAASDLGDLSDYGRARGERHHRHLHRPGIVLGLALETQDATDANGTPYKRVFVGTGLALDGFGREILITERKELDAQRFRRTIGASADAASFFPVFLRSQFVAQPASSTRLDQCQSTRGNRIEERVDVFVGRVGEETAFETEIAPPGTTASAAEGVGPPLLIGFVQWDPAASQFSGTTDSANGATRRYAGVNAETIAGIGNRLLLQLNPTTAPGDLAVELDGGLGVLRFGPLQASGTMGEPLFSVDRDGNLQAKGTLTGRSARASVLVQGGLASDGLILPLPSGVTEAQIEDGDASVQVLVAPRLDKAHAPASTATVIFAPFVEECRVDENRRLLCRILWTGLDFSGGGGSPTLVSTPGAADYVVIASTKSKEAT